MEITPAVALGSVVVCGGRVDVSTSVLVDTDVNVEIGVTVPVTVAVTVLVEVACVLTTENPLPNLTPLFGQLRKIVYVPGVI